MPHTARLFKIASQRQSLNMLNRHDCRRCDVRRLNPSCKHTHSAPITPDCLCCDGRGASDRRQSGCVRRALVERTGVGVHQTVDRTGVGVPRAVERTGIGVHRLSRGPGLESTGLSRGPGLESPGLSRGLGLESTDCREDRGWSPPDCREDRGWSPPGCREDWDWSPQTVERTGVGVHRRRIHRTV